MTTQSFLKLEESAAEYSVISISHEETRHFILNIHYAKRMPSISYAYGLIQNGALVGVITYGMPASPFLCIGICGENYKERVLELNRLCLLNNKKNEASMLIGRSLRLLPKPSIIVSYADTAMKHSGFVYQATNFLFTGTTKERTDMASINGKHSRHNDGDKNKRQFRSSKHRYVYFLGSKKELSEMKKSLKYPIMKYPKL